MSAGDLSVYGEWLVQETNGCTCFGGDAHHGHEPGCGYEPLLKVADIAVALKAAGYAVVELPATAIDEWDETTVPIPELSGGKRAVLRIEPPATLVNGRIPVRISPLGVPNPIGVDDARLFAAALLAAADVAEAADA